VQDKTRQCWVQVADHDLKYDLQQYPALIASVSRCAAVYVAVDVCLKKSQFALVLTARVI